MRHHNKRALTNYHLKNNCKTWITIIKLLRDHPQHNKYQIAISSSQSSLSKHLNRMKEILKLEMHQHRSLRIWMRYLRWVIRMWTTILNNIYQVKFLNLTMYRINLWFHRQAPSKVAIINSMCVTLANPIFLVTIKTPLSLETWYRIINRNTTKGLSKKKSQNNRMTCRL